MTRSKVPDTRAHRSDKPARNNSREASQVSNAGQTLTTPAVTRTQSETRLIAIRLQDAPAPFFSKKQLEHRWQIGPDTVRKLLLKESIDPGPKKGLLISLFDILHLEAVNDPLGLWVTATEDIQAVLSADLLTLDDWRAHNTGKSAKLHSDTIYRKSQRGLLQSIRIGKFHRFRRTALQSREWLSCKGGKLT
jgi:hypothetical protein